MQESQTKNRYYKHSRISEAKFRQVVKGFAMDLTATETAELTSISVRSINSIYLKIRQRLVEHSDLNSPYPADEAANSIYSSKQADTLLAFGIYQQDQHAYSELVKPNIRQVIEEAGRRSPDVEQLSKLPEWPNYSALAIVNKNKLLHTPSVFDAQFIPDTAIIEGFWSMVKKRMQKFNGIHRHTFYLHLKECEFRFNHRDKPLYQEILTLLRENPL